MPMIKRLYFVPFTTLSKKNPTEILTELMPATRKSELIQLYNIISVKFPRRTGSSECLPIPNFTS